MQKPLLIIAIILLPLTQVVAGDLFDTPRDYALVLRSAPIYESLELYAEVVSDGQPGQILPLVTTVEDDYGTRWAEVRVDEDTTGFISDVITLRMERELLEAIVSSFGNEDLGLLDQETIDGFLKEEAAVGMNLQTLLLSQGRPLAQRTIGTAMEYVYPEKQFLLVENQVLAVVHQQQVPGKRDIEILITTADPDFQVRNGTWSTTEVVRESATGLIPAEYSTVADSSGAGLAEYTFIAPVDGLYRLETAFTVSDDHSDTVTATVRSRGEKIGTLYCNQRLETSQVTLGTIRLQGGQTYRVLLESAGDRPFSAGPLAITYLTISGSSADTE